MLGSKRNKAVGWLLGGLVVVTIASADAVAERLPIKTYTSADGLAHNVVNQIVRDSRGFLWFCTQEGLSRFDGYGFTNYGIGEGLPSAFVNDFIETREGDYWVATSGGLCRFNPLGKPQASISSANERNALDGMFTVYFPGDEARSKYVLSLLQDRDGSIWCGTRNGLYRMEEAADEVKFTLMDLGIPDHFESRFIECLLEDRRGALWIGSRSGLYRRWPDGRVEAYTTRDGLPHNIPFSLLEDRDGRIWVGTGWGWPLYRLVSDPIPGRNVVARVYSAKDGLPATLIVTLFQATDGSLWAGSAEGLIQFVPTADGQDFRFRAYAEPHGLSTQEVMSLAEDRNGNLWLGTASGGAAKIARNGFTTFGKADGFSQSTSILESKAGDVIVLGGPGTGIERFINQFDGEKFIPIRPQVPELIKKYGYGWGWNQTVLEDHTGEWWIATAAGVCRFPKVSRPEQLAHTSPKAIYTTRDGLSSDRILRLFEDSRGDIWIGTVGHGYRVTWLTRWERRTNTFHHYTEKDHLPRFDLFYVSSFAEDRAGNLWIGFSGEGGLVRYRDGRFTLFTANDGLPAGQIRNMLVDSAGRLWAASYRSGLIRIDDPAAERPRPVTYTTADGLSSNEIAVLTEDQWGRIYFGTGRGIDRLDPATGRIKHYTTADGLPLSAVNGSLRDRKGTLWFSFQTGVARLVPEPDPSPVPPPVLITGLRIAGETRQISSLGEVEIAPVELGADNNQLQIDFVALGFSPGEGLRYQYLLEGASEEWSELAEQRTVNFANLAPGAYRFLVRGVNSDGVMSETPASFSFTILPPVWQRWWFLTLAALAIGLAAYSLFRYRLRRLLELERVRTHIASDLHDDIGSSLSQIAILSEVLRVKAGPNDLNFTTPLSQIARVSSEAVDSMSDIVWAINPKRDHLFDLSRRMRRFASELFPASNIEFSFNAPGESEDLELGADVRRQVFLIFKEGINNIARHSGCQRADIELRIEGAWLVLTVSDDGKGLDVSLANHGNGLLSMRRRAQGLGGKLDIASDNGKGTTLTLRIPHRIQRLRPGSESSLQSNND